MRALNIIFIALIVAVTLTTSGCKKEKVAAQDFANAYMRVIVMDAPASGSVQFTLDNKINANGDSVTYNADGSIYREDPAMTTTSVINYPSGGWSDNSPLNFAGVFGYYNIPAHQFSFFPNPTDRIALAPAVGKINFFNWAALPAAQHQLAFYSVVTGNVYGNNIQVRGPKAYDQPITLEGNAVQTVMLVNKSPCKEYIPAGIMNNDGFPYGMNESTKYVALNMDVVTFKDHPAKMPNFKDTCAYIRFMNVTPNYNDQVTNQNTDQLDIYIAPLYGRPNWTDYNKSSSNYITKIGPEVLVAKNLSRFESQVDQPFIEIPLGQYMKKTASGAPDTVGRPKYFRVLAYRAGQSKAGGFQPQAVGDWLSIYNNFPFTSSYSVDPYLSPAGTNIDSFLLRYDGVNYHPTIATIPIAVSQTPYPVPGFAANTELFKYLGYRSIIDYVQVGVNQNYYKH